jgi:hypothetical protein
MFGYLIATVALWVGGTHPSSCLALLCWRWPFVMQTVLVTPLIIALWITPAEHLRITSDDSKPRERTDSATSISGSELNPTLQNDAGASDSALAAGNETCGMYGSTGGGAAGGAGGGAGGVVVLSRMDAASISASYITPRHRLDCYETTGLSPSASSEGLEQMLQLDEWLMQEDKVQLGTSYTVTVW